MSHDGLRHLVQRTLQPEPAVAPRLPSRYEDEGGVGAPDSDLRQYDEVTAPRPPGYPASTGPIDSGPESPRTGTTQGDARPSKTDLRPGHDRPADPAPTTLRRASAASAALPPTSKNSPGTSEVPRPPEPGASRVVPTTSSGATGRAAGAPPAAGQQQTVEPRPTGQHPSDDPIPRVAALMPATALISEELFRPEPESVVHITIGRVEVHATPSGTPARSPQQPPERHVMSLAEYLDRRSSSGTSR
jgi:hypothetical protein